MTARRSSRPSHVRPRPPSGSRPAPKKVALRPIERYRTAPRRAGERRTQLPLPARLILGAAVAAFAVVVFAAATGGISTLVSALGSSFSGFFDDVLATPSPSEPDIIVADSPIIVPPSEPYTNKGNLDLELVLPEDVSGDTEATVRIYVAFEGGAPAAIAEVPVGSTTRLIVPVALTPGRNDFTATVVRPGSESDPSPLVTFILDQEPPPIKVDSPTEGQTVNGESATISGVTQGRSTLIARNDTNGASTSGVAESDGGFSIALPLATGSNALTLAVTDPAGNVGQVTINVVRGSGALTASLSASAYRISTARLPATIQLAVIVTDPDGAPLAGAAVTFSLTVPGIPPLTFDTVTGADGRAVFSTTLPRDVIPGAGNATVFVSTERYGNTTSGRNITIVP